MKKETKEILDYLINEHSKLIGNYDGFTEQDKKWNERERKIYNFLISIPEIESHLCLGGYIQDKNGTPCCDGDKVKFQYDEGFYNGTLTFNFTFKCFTIVNENGVFFWINNAIKWFEKCED